MFRFFASLYGAQMEFWLSHPEEYWAGFDSLIDTIEQFNLSAIPSLGYCMTDSANAALGLNETINDCVRNTSSGGFRLQVKFYSEIVTRYVGRRGVLAWELGNELNNIVNLHSGGPCGPDKCFNTSEMVAHTTRLVDVIKGM